MKPATLQRLEDLIQQAAQDELLEHQAEMARAFSELQASVQYGHEVGRAYLQGVREERSRVLAIISREMKTCNRGSLAHNRLQRLLNLVVGDA